MNDRKDLIDRVYRRSLMPEASIPKRLAPRSTSSVLQLHEAVTRSLIVSHLVWHSPQSFLIYRHTRHFLRAAVEGGPFQHPDPAPPLLSKKLQNVTRKPTTIS